MKDKGENIEVKVKSLTGQQAFAEFKLNYRDLDWMRKRKLLGVSQSKEDWKIFFQKLGVV